MNTNFAHLGKRIAASVVIPAGKLKIHGEFDLPASPRGIVVFVHVGGHHLPRNYCVARAIRNAGIGTLLVDLLTPQDVYRDKITGIVRYDLVVLAQRLVEVAQWLREQRVTAGIKLGFFGTGTGGGASLLTAADLGDQVTAVVSCSGRPNLSSKTLALVTAPTLLVVGGWDEQMTALNHEVYAKLHCEKDLQVLPRASHLFEEPGKLEQVALLSADWFGKHMGGER